MFSGWIFLLLVTPLYFFSNLQKVIIPGAAFDELQQVFALDAAGVTRLGAVFLGVYAAAQLVIGVLADRYGGAKVIVTGGLLFCAGSICSAFDNNLYLLYFSRFLTGAGAASVYLSMVKEFSRIAPDTMTLMLGVATIIGYSGSITGAAPFIAGVDRFGYFTMVFAAGMATLISYLIYTVFACKNGFTPVNREVRFSIKGYLSVFKSRQNCCLIFAVGISFGTYFALQSTVGKKFLEDFCHLSNHAAGIVLTVTMLIAAVNGFIMANISRKLNNRRLPVIIFSGCGCFAGALLILLGVWLQATSVLPITGMILLAFAGNVSPIYVALLNESNDEKCFGTVVCVGNCFAYAVSSAFSGGAGKLMDIFAPQIINGIKIYSRNSYLLVFGVLTVLGVISAALASLVRESYGKKIN